jgi:PAS domain S-box-containing protein
MGPKRTNKMGEENNKQGPWPTAWMDQLPSALLLLKGSEVIQMNGLARFLFGWKPEEKGLDLFKGNWLVWKEEDKVYFDMKWSSIEEAKRMPVRMELEASRDGEMKFQVELRLSPSPQKGLDLLQVVDISEQRFRQQALQDREAHYRRLNDIAQEAIVLVKDSVVLDVNSRFLVMLGVEHPEEVIGDSVKQLGLRRIGNLEPIEGSGVFDRGDWVMQNRNGEAVHLDIGKGRLDDDSEVWMMYDVSDRKRIEFDLIQERERFRLLVQSSPNGIVILVDDLVRYANPVAEQLFSSSSEGPEGARFSSLFPESVKERISQSSTQARQGKNVEEWELELPETGKRLTMKWRLTIFDGQPAVQVNLSDVTDRYSLMQERIRAELAEEANQLLTQQIEQRIAAEAALTSATARMRSIVESGEDFIIWTAVRDFEVTSVNQNFVQWLFPKAEKEPVLSGLSGALSAIVKESEDKNGFDLNDRFNRALSGQPQRFEWSIESPGQSERRWLQLFLNPIESSEDRPEISAIAYDITERKRIDRAIRGALKEKEILLQEVHHRVKNNLQIINSILNLQKNFVEDENAITGLEEIQNRVSTMSIIHETLYQNTDVSSIGFSSYLTRIAGNIIQSYRSSTMVELVTELEDIQAPLDQAIPCGLILNEWVSNAMKYAFEGRENGTITVALRRVEPEDKPEEEEIQIEVRDDGVGLPEGFDWSGRDSLGLYLVQALSEQLDGELLAESDGGTRFLVSFRRPKNLFDG